MRSKLLTEGRSTGFFEDLTAVLEIPEQVIHDACALYSEKAKFGKVPSKEDHIDLLKNGAVSFEKLLRALRWIFHVLDQVRVEGDSLDLILDDLVELNKIQDTDALRRKLDPFNGSLQRDLLALKRGEHVIKESFPYLTRIRTRVGKVYDIAKSFDPENDTPEEYQPTVSGEIPFVITRLEIEDDGESKIVTFGMTIEKAQLVVKHMQLAIVETLAATALIREKKIEHK